VVTLLFDSAILIDHFNGIAAASSYLSENHADAAISVVTRAEVLTGFDRGGARQATELLDSFPILGIDKTIADLAAIFRRDHRWKLTDAFQAAIARHHGLLLVTRDRRDFSPRRYPFVVIPYRV
jgi:predicted nucleic acid-binding protein